MSRFDILFIVSNLLVHFSKFGMAFRMAAQRIHARVRHDGFEMAGIEVKAEDLKAFINALQSTYKSHEDGEE